MQDNNDPVCCSGGADGADYAWGVEAAKHGHGVMHFVFSGHKSKAPKHQLVCLDEQQLTVANEHVARANDTLKRSWPPKSRFVGNLLRRNYYQVIWSGSLYAIGTFDKNGGVAGGTAWAVEMMKNLHPEGKIYFYDQKRGNWAQWKGGWFSIIKPPKPEGIWAGIGTRDLNEKGTKAIIDVFL